jgi:Spore coat assembly protein
MKIKFVIIAIFILLLIMTGCAKETVSEVEPVIETTETITEFYGLEIIPYDKYVEYNTKYKESRKSLISDLYFDDKKLPKDTDDNKFFLPLSMNNDTFESGTITYNENNIQLYFVQMTENVFENLDKEYLISNNKLLIMVAVDTENEMYTVCRLVFTGLPIITVNNKDEVRNYDYPIDRNDSKAEMRLFDTKQNVMESDILIHTRGGSSSSFPKIGYKMNLIDANGEGVNMNLLNLRKDDDWVLVPMYSDESMIRDKLTYDLWSEYGATNNDYAIHNGPEAEYIELFINDRYWGLYMLVVPVDKKQQDLADNEILCKIEDWVVPTVSRLRRARTSNAVNSITIKKPDAPTQETWNNIADFVDLWFEMPREDFIKKAPEMVDIDNVIDFWILLNLTKGKDNAWKNMYLTWKMNADGTYKVLISPWDCDLSWGVMWQDQNPLLWEYTFHFYNEILDFRLGDRIIRYNIDNAVDKLQARWTELRNGILKEKNLFQRIDTLTNYIHDTGAWNRDLSRWKSAGHSDDMNEYLKTFATAVFGHLDEYIKNMG